MPPAGCSDQLDLGRGLSITTFEKNKLTILFLVQGSCYRVPPLQVVDEAAETGEQNATKSSSQKLWKKTLTPGPTQHAPKPRKKNPKLLWRILNEEVSTFKGIF